MQFWVNAVEKQYTKDQIVNHVKFKPYRELWVGAIVAASQTRINKVPHYVGLPPDEPPDAEVVRFVPVITSKGSEGTNLEKIGLEIVRCDLDAGETIFGQIQLKNKPAYAGMSVAVYVYGGDAMTDLNDVQRQVNALPKIYPHEIMLVAPVQRSASIVFDPGTFAITQFYPKMGQDLVNIFDTKAFFMQSNVMTVTGRGVSRKKTRQGDLELMPPDLSSGKAKQNLKT